MCEIATEHPSKDVFDDFVYKDACLIMAFQTPFLIQTDEGIVRGSPGDCIVHTPGYHAFHTGAPDMSSGWTNDWAYIGANDLPLLLTDTGVPTNALIHTQNPLFLRDQLSEIIRETAHRRSRWEQRVSLLIQDVLLCLSRAATESSPETSAYFTALCELREQIYTSPNSDWTVQRMADSLNLSKSRFFTIYKKQFGTTPMNDLLEFRMERAIRLLQSTSYSISDIAAKCGFSSEFYFSNFFKKKMGISPIRYRQKR